ncbi:unnamed protein product [Closterium sp. NIES-54]
MSADKLSIRAIPCVFLGLVPDVPGWQFYHPTLRRVFPSQDVTFDESVPFYRLFPYRSAPPLPPPLFLAPCPPAVDPLPPQDPAPSGVSHVDPLPCPAHVEVAFGSGAACGGAELGGAESEGAGSGGAEPGGAKPAGVEPEGVEPGGAESEGAKSGGAEPRGAALSGVGGTRDAGAGGAGVTAGPGGVEGAGAGDPTEPGATGAGGASAGGAGAGGVGAAGDGAVYLGAGGARDTVRPRPYFVPLLQVLGVPSSPSLNPPLLCSPPDKSQLQLQPASPLPAPSPYTEQSGGFTEQREPASRPVLPVCTAHRVPRSRPPPIHGTHDMALRPSSVPLRVSLPSPPDSSLPEVFDPVPDRARAACPTVARLLATAMTDPSFESAAASALVAELLDFAAASRLDYATALDDFECLAAAIPRFPSMLLAPEGDSDAPDIPTLRSYAEAITGTYVDGVPPSWANIVDGMWIFRVKRPPGSPPAFKARFVARGFSQRQGVDYFQTFSPTPKMTTLRVLLHVAAQREYELHSLEFSTAFLQSSLHKEIWLHRPPCFTGSFPTDTQWSLRRRVYGLRQAPLEWHDTLRTTLAALGFARSTADPSLFLRIDTSMPLFYVLVYVDDLIFATADTKALTLVKSELQKRHTCTDPREPRSYLGLQITRDRARRTITLTQSHMVHQVLLCFGFQFSSPQPTPLSTSHSLSAPPSDESVEPSGPYPELVGCLMYLMTCTRPDLAYPLSLLARYVAPGRHRKVHWDAAKRVLRYLCSTSGMGLVLGGWGPVVLSGHADASWEHRTKDIALRYFIARELQQRGQLRLAYVATRANTADVFTKALPPAPRDAPAALLAAPCGPITAPCCCLPCALCCPASPCSACCATVASLRVLVFDHVFDTWLDDLQLYLLSDSRDSVSLFDHTSSATPAPPATADSATRSQWLTHDAAARLAIRNHLPLAECAHFGQHKTAQALYDAVVACYSLPATAALGRLLLPYLFPELSAFATEEDLVSHLRTSDARYRVAAPAESLDKNQPPMFITLYFIVTRLRDFVRSVRDHFLSLDPTVLTIDLLEQHLIAAETIAVAVGAARGTPRTPFFEGCSPSPLAPSYASAAAVDVPRVVAVIAGVVVGAAVEVVAAVAVVAGVGALVAAVEAAVGVAVVAAVGVVAVGLELSVEVLEEARGKGSSIRARPRRPSSFSAEFGDEVERPHWAELLRSGVAIFDLDYDALSASAKGDCYRCVPPDPGIDAAALGASESSLPGTAPAEAFHTFMLDSSASRCFFRDSTTLTPVPAPVPVRLADPSKGPVVARSSTVLPDPAVAFSSLSGLHLPSFSTILVSTAALQDSMVTTTTPGGQRVSICTCTRTGRHLATFTHQSGSSLYTLATEPPQVAASAQVSASPPALAGPTLPSLRRGAAARPSSLLLVPLDVCSPADLWGPARVSGKGRERYFLLVVDDYTRYTTVFPLRSKGQVVDVLIPWIRVVSLQLRERFHQDLPVLRLHSDRGGEFSSDLLREFCHGEGILHSFTLPDSPQQNGIVEHCIGLVMEVACTSMIHAAAPHFLWPFTVRYASHQLNLWPHVSLPESSPILRWTGEAGDALVFWVWGSRAFVRDSSADKLSARAIPFVFLGFPPDAPGWQFYHPTSHHVFPSQDVMFDKSVPFYHLFPYRSAPPPPPPLFIAPGPPPVDPLPPQGPAPSGVSQVDPLPGTVLVEVAGDSGAASGGAEPVGAESEGAGSGGAEPWGAEPKVAEPKGVETGGAESEGAEFGGAGPRSAALSGGPARASPRLSPRPETLCLQHLCTGDTEAGGAGVTAEAGGTGGACTRGTGAAGTGGVGGAGVGDPTEPGAAGVGGPGAGGTGAGGAGVGGAGAGGTGAGGAGAGGAGAGGTGTGGAGDGGTGAVDPRSRGAGAVGSCGTCAGGTVRPRPYFVPLLQKPASPLPAPSPYTEQSGGLTKHRESVSCPVSPVRTARCVPRSRPPPVPGTHTMALRPSSVPLRVPLPPPPESSLPAVPDPESDLVRAASPTVSHLLATIVTDPSFETTAVSALVAELLDFAVANRLDYDTALVAESESASPPSVEGECALGTDVLEDRQDDFECLAAAVPCFASLLLAPEGDLNAPDLPTPRSYAEAITGPYSSQCQAAMDAEMTSLKSTGTYVDAVPPSRANIVDGMWIFRVKPPPGSPPAFKAHYVARGFSQRHGVDYFKTFSPTPKMTTLRVLLDVAAQRDYELHSLDFSTAYCT